VIGRRKQLTEEELEKKASFFKHHDIHLMTYDRLLDAAKKLDAFETLKPNQQIRRRANLKHRR
jgi:hypothetical protein